ncbi:MAG: metal ABC transporter substrate-binding protein, partial [Nocardioides sp.]|nr:metal ABC transporter substrate-binding protein [Nocardioides sp.]
YLGRYGLHFESLTGITPGAEPSAGTRARLEALVTSEGVTTVFAESLGSKDDARSLADDLGVATQVLDPIEGLSDLTSGEDYLSLMRSNLAALKKANGC